MSKLEEKVELLLKQAGLQYKREISFIGLVGKKKVPLRFDFGVFKGRNLLFCLEIDGKQHYQYTPYFHKTRTVFKKQQERDRLKNKFCLMNNIPLVRVPYYEINENLTLNKILTTPDFLVKDKYHIDNLIRKGVK